MFSWKFEKYSPQKTIPICDAKIYTHKTLGYRLIRPAIVVFFTILLIGTFTPLVNTQTLYTPLNFPGPFNLSELSYPLSTFSYTNYTLNPEWLSLTSSFNQAGRYYIASAQSGFTNYLYQPTQNRSSGVNSSLLYKNLFSSYQNPFTSFNYQSYFTQGWGSTSFNMPYTSYIPTSIGYTPYVFSTVGYPSIYYPGYGYPYTYYPGYNYPWAPTKTDNQQESSKTIGTIGIITDIHYTDKNSTDRRFRDSMSGPRFYSEAKYDLTDFVNRMNSMGVDAAIELGDFIDVHSGNSLAEGNTNTHNDGTQGEAILLEAESIYSKLSIPYYHVVGNWDMYDYDFVTAGDWFKYIVNGTPGTIKSLGGKVYTDAIGNPVSRYYSFKFGSVLGIVLDSSGSAVSGDAYLMNTTGITGTGYVPQKQLDWLKGVLADNTAGKNMPVIVFIHPFLYPIFTGSNYYMCKNHSSVRSILEADKNVIAVFNGHHHPGAQGWWEDINNNPKSNVYHIATGVFGEKYNGIKYYNLRGSIIGWGSDPSGPIEKPSNIYYVLTVNKKGSSISIEVKSFRTN